MNVSRGQTVDTKDVTGVSIYKGTSGRVHKETAHHSGSVPCLDILQWVGTLFGLIS